MENSKRDLLVVFRIDSLDQTALEHQVESLHSLLVTVENDATFCQAHELVTRIRITSKPKRILKAVAFQRLKPFEFLINKN